MSGTDAFVCWAAKYSAASLHKGRPVPLLPNSWSERIAVRFRLSIPNVFRLYPPAGGLAVGVVAARVVDW
jgi:hypothetical protein